MSLDEGDEKLSARQARRPLETARTRLFVAGAIFTLCFVILGGRLVQLSLLGGGQNQERAAEHQGGLLTLQRADIVDRNGALLATNLPSHSLYVNPSQVLDAVEAADKITRILPELSRDKVLRKASATGQFAWIKRNLTPDQHYAINRLGLPGFSFEREERRVYPHGSLFVHTLGFAGIDNAGLAGLEAARDDDLKQIAKTPDGKMVTALDSRVQHIVHAELSAAMATFKAKGAAGIVMDVHSGEVLALSSLPDFNPYELDSSIADQRFNRATLGVYELGSTFKAFTTAMALEYGVVDINDRYDATKPLKVARFTIRDDHPQNRWLDVPEIFVHSSNIGAAQMARDVGAERQKDFLARLGMLSPLPFELAENGKPLSPRHWREINTMTIGYGHGIAVTPLHLISGFATLVNGGMRTTPTLLRRPVTQTGERVIARETSDAMRMLMRMVVEQGTGKQAEAEGYLVGGKTGTAEKATVGGYKKDALITTFVGAFPMDAPRYAVLVMLDEPHGNDATHGLAAAGWNAAPVFGRIVSQIAPMLGVMPLLPSGEEQQQDQTQRLLVRADGKGRNFASF
ncbi:MAG: penicillin-binding protein 2 [Rhodospirillaceae bacterium]|nr:penicillin-binding protein 2 [Rhodospirillaceae bacterium]MBT3927467.1 penicillin-binding protein 2 [Rhodospirillaceae bacterium]MBT4428333.1 penicillin-binding protein 2 [Rhodospirillaceae bacterium]MBT5037732.1 penicillin-binding protein 2 [Rhodospirillaceae bacterium]MBT5674794.1 penicillin-binding protein 2 [Rhodospirillaceae bacterium]